MEISIGDICRAEVALMHVLSLKLHAAAPSAVRYLAHGREDHLLYYHLQGQRVYEWQDGSHMECRVGDVLLLPMNSRYDSVTSQEPSIGYVVRFVLMDDTGEKVQLTGGPQRLLHDARAQLLPAFETLYSLSMHLGSTLQQKEKLAALLQEIVQLRPETPDGTWLNTAQEYMSTHLQHPVTIQRLANLCHMSERTFCRRFREETGVPPIAYHRMLRIRKAGELLSSGICTLEYVAEALGFTDAAHLSRCFFRETGMHPGEMKRTQQLPHEKYAAER